MFLRDILVYVDDSAGVSVRVETAAALAAAHGARLTGFHVRPTIEIPYLARSFNGQGLAEALAKAADTLSGEAHGLFTRHAAAHSDTRWEDLTGSVVDVAAARARCSDLIVLGPSEIDQPSGRRMSGQIIQASGTPVLMVPERPAVATVGQRVLVAWNSSPESIRAVRSALPILKAAASVEVLVVLAGEPDTDFQMPGRPLVDYLSQHGVAATVKVMRLDEVHGVGGSILARAKGTGADLIVMGAFGRSRLREAMIGSTTGRLLTQSSVPILVAH